MFTSKDVQERREDTTVAAGSDILAEPRVKQHKQVVTPPNINKPRNVSDNLKPTETSSQSLSPPGRLSAAKSPSKSPGPGYFRKPMPINEPKPILPPSKQIILETPQPQPSSTPAPAPAVTSVAARSRQLVSNFRKSVEENSNSLAEGRRRLLRRISQEDPVTPALEKDSGRTEDSMKKNSISPLSKQKNN